MRYLLYTGLSIGLNLVINAYASPRFYATMGFDTPVRTGMTIGKILLGIIIFAFFFKVFKKSDNKL